MTLADIDKVLRAQLPNMISLTPAVFENDSNLTPLLNSYFYAQNGALQINPSPSSYNFDEANGRITFSGTGVNGAFSGLAISNVTINFVNNAPQISVTAALENQTTLVDLFPSLNAPILKILTFENAEIFWASFDSDTYDTVLGYYFAGNVDFDDPPLNLIQLLFPSAKGPQLWGKVSMVGTETEDATQYVPDMLLWLDASAEKVNLGPLKLEGPKLQITSNPFFNAADFRWQTDGKISISTPVAFKNTWFELSVELQDNNSNILFDAQIGTPLTGLITDIGDLFGVELSVPHFQVPTSKDLFLKDIKVSFDTSTKKVNLISIDVGMNDGEQWPIWDGIFLEKIDVTFLLTPAAQGGFNVEGQIFGVVSDWLALSADFSKEGYSFVGRLADPDNPPDLKTIYEMFSDKPEAEKPDLPDITVSTLYIEIDGTPGNNAKSTFSFDGDISIEGDWPLITSPDTVSIEGIRFHLKKDTDDLNFEVGGIFGISDYSMTLDATYDTNNGWAFSGDLELKGLGKGISDISQKIDGSYSSTSPKPTNIPPYFSDWYVLNLNTQFNNKVKDLDFVLDISNSAYPWLEADFGIHLKHSDQAYIKELDAELSISTDTLYADFKLELEESTSTEQPPVTTYTAEGAYSTQKGKEPKLSELLAYLAQNNPSIQAYLPQELDFDAIADGFALKITKVGDGPTVIELAGEFGLKVDGSTWDLYLAFTNDTNFAQNANTPSGLTDNTPAPYVFGVALGGLLDLSKLPLVGKISGIDKFRIDKLGFYYTNAPFSEQNKQLNFSVPSIGDPGKLAQNATEAYLTHSGFTLMAVFGNQQEDADSTTVKSSGTMPLSTDTGAPPAGQSGFAKQPATPKDPISWLDLNKTLGPVTFEKIGLAYTKAANPETQLGNFGFYINGSFKIGGFEMALDRLGVSFNIPKPDAVGFNPMKDIGFHLGGLFVDYQAPDFQIAGGFISLPDSGGVNFIGEFMVQAGPLGLQAYGGFSNDNGQTSLFIFLHLNAPLGGPPFFFINGVAGGFGVNRNFVLPTFDQLTSYPFLPANNTIPTASAVTGSAAQQLQTMSTAMMNLARYVPVQDGQYWFALGLDVSSFEMIEVSAVLSVAFGVKLQVGLVGSASMTLPVQEPEPIAFIQIDFEVSFSPSDGTLAAFGKLTPASYVFANFIHLSGGFAFYTWFSGLHKGDFVVTLGGYNPYYQKPDYYPTVPRLQLAFSVGNLNVVGQSYFALTGNALMAGFGIHATWDLGPIHAWFDAGVDFLIGWKPFHYIADAYVDVGVSLVIKVLFVHVRITIHVGIDLVIWGPSFGGKGRVHLSIISFTIHFGADQKLPPPVEWSDFKQFLPNINGNSQKAPLAAAGAGSNPPLVNLSVSKGLAKSFKPGEDPSGLDWLVNANDFEIDSSTIAATTDAQLNQAPDLKGFSHYIDPDNLTAGVENEINNKQSAPYFAYKPAKNEASWDSLQFGIPPMRLTDIKATFTTSIQSIDDENNAVEYINDLIVVLQTSGVQSAMWGNKGADTASLKGKDSVIPGAFTGFRILPMIWFPLRTSLIPVYYLVFDTNNLFLAPAPMPAFDTTPVSNPATVYADMDSGEAFSSTEANRAEIVQWLQQNGFDYFSLENDGAFNTAQYVAEPMLAHFS